MTSLCLVVDRVRVIVLDEVAVDNEVAADELVVVSVLDEDDDIVVVEVVVVAFVVVVVVKTFCTALAI